MVSFSHANLPQWMRMANQRPCLKRAPWNLCSAESPIGRYAAIFCNQYSWCSPPCTAFALIRHSGGNSWPLIPSTWQSLRRFWNSWSQTCMWAASIVMGNPLPQDSPQMLFAQRDDPVQTLSSYRADQAFAIGIRLWRLNRRS
jgi:hypothetical protein